MSNDLSPEQLVLMRNRADATDFLYPFVGPETVELAAIRDRRALLDHIEPQARRIAELERQLVSIAKGVSIKIPTNTMEQEFQSHYRRGYEAGRASVPPSNVRALAIAAGKYVEHYYLGRGDNIDMEGKRLLSALHSLEYGTPSELSHEPVAVQSIDLLLQPESKEPITVLPNGMITVPKGHFWRGEINRFFCRNCGKHHDAHLHTDEASLCPRETSNG